MLAEWRDLYEKLSPPNLSDTIASALLKATDAAEKDFQRTGEAPTRTRRPDPQEAWESTSVYVRADYGGSDTISRSSALNVNRSAVAAEAVEAELEELRARVEMLTQLRAKINVAREKRSAKK